MNTKDKYLTSETLEGAARVIREYFKNPSGLEFRSCGCWCASRGLDYGHVHATTNLSRLVNGDTIYRIKNPNYIKPEHVPQFGDIYELNMSGLIRIICDIYDNGDIIFMRPEHSDTTRSNSHSFKSDYTFTGRRLDLNATVEVEE